jgi:hypothetical protein
MADDNTLRSYRSNDPYKRDAGPSGAQDAGVGTDPLAELARLIGQTDPFADAARNNAPGAERQAASAGDWRQHIERPPYQTMRDEQPMPADPLGDYQDDPRYAPASGYDDRTYQPSEQGHDGYADHQPAAMAAPGPAGPSGEEFYDDPPNRHARASRGRSWLATTAMLAACAMLGTVGAYGYRTYAKPSSSPKAAPVIIADSSPSKILPAAAEQKSTRSQERLPAQGSNERLVSREEQPVALPPGGGSPPRVVFPSPVQPAPSAPPPAATAAPPAASAPPPGPAPAAATPAAASTEPKRVRTVTIRNERPDASGRPVTTSQSAREQAAPPPSRGARTAPPRAAEPASRGEPLSLDPAAQAQAREPARPQQRAAVTPPAPRESAPPASARQTWEPAPRETAPAPEAAPNAPRLASAPANDGNGSGGGYLVQVSSQRSQSDAQASYRGLQAKYPQLKSRQATIRRADLGSKGVYYRAMVGPFGSAGEAGQFCNSLKQAGGQCIILRN